MSITSRLVSAAFAAGAALAVGYGIKKLGEKVDRQAHQTQHQPENEPEIIGTADSKITLKVGNDKDWSYVMRDKGVVKESENKHNEEVRQFQFVPLKDGVTELEFDYRPKGSDESLQTITYNIEVRNGRIIRCDAAGDLEMIAKEKNT